MQLAGQTVGTQSARDALGLAVLGRQHAMRAPPARRERPFLIGILDRDLVRIEQMLERERHAFQRRAHVARLLDRPLEHLDADGHQSAPPFGSCGREPRSVRTARRELGEIALVEPRIRRADQPSAIDDAEHHDDQHDVDRQHDQRRTATTPDGCPRVLQHERRAGDDDDVRERHRQHELPAERHELVVAEARQRPADPDEHEDEEQDLRPEERRTSPAS